MQKIMTYHFPPVEYSSIVLVMISHYSKSTLDAKKYEQFKRIVSIFDEYFISCISPSFLKKKKAANL